MNPVIRLGRQETAISVSDTLVQTPRDRGLPTGRAGGWPSPADPGLSILCFTMLYKMCLHPPAHCWLRGCPNLRKCRGGPLCWHLMKHTQSSRERRVGPAMTRRRAVSHEAGLGSRAEGTSCWSMRKTIAFTQAWRAGELARPGSLHSALLTFRLNNRLLGCGGCPVHYRVLSSIPGL